MSRCRDSRRKSFRVELQENVQAVQVPRGCSKETGGRHLEPPHILTPHQAPIQPQHSQPTAHIHSHTIGPCYHTYEYVVLQDFASPARRILEFEQMLELCVGFKLRQPPRRRYTDSANVLDLCLCYEGRRNRYICCGFST